MRTLTIPFGGFEPKPLGRWCSAPKLTNTTTYLSQSDGTYTFCVFISKLHTWPLNPNTACIEHQARKYEHKHAFLEIMKKTLHNKKNENITKDKNTSKLKTKYINNNNNNNNT